MEKLGEQMQPLTKKKEKLESELTKVQERHDEAKAELNAIENELKLVQQNEMSEKKKYEHYKTSL